MRESSLKKSEEIRHNEHMKEILQKTYQDQEIRKLKLIEEQNEKSQRSGMAKQHHYSEVLDKKFRGFLQSEDKKFNVQKIARQQQYERDMLDEKIHGDNNRSEKIKHERAEIMIAKQRLRRDIDKDKQLILEDFELIKQGKIDPEVVAKKYGYTGKSTEDRHLSQSHLSHNQPSNRGASQHDQRQSQTQTGGVRPMQQSR